VIASKVAMDEPPESRRVSSGAPVVIRMNADSDKLSPPDTSCPFSKNPP
jgi:hypothetical protein